MGLDIGVPEGVALKDIPGLPDIYKAGSDGKIYSFSTARTNAKKPKPFRLSVGVSQSTIMRIARGQDWKHIK
jgi:hypothetical protein